jgi:hypothetical protein
MLLARRVRSRRATAVVTVAGLLCGVVLVWRAASATFTGTTSNPTNSWQAGTVTLADDDGGNSPTTGTAMFSTGAGTANLMPGNTGTHCIRVTYNGSLGTPTAVKVYATGLAGTGLGTYLDFTIEEDTNGQGDYANCGGFTGSFIHQAGTPAGSNGTLGYFAANMTDYATGVGTWTPTAAGQARTYRFRYTVQNNGLAQGLTASLNLVWEVHSS